MLKKILFGFTTVALVAASAASYNVSLTQDAKVDGKALKAGEYKVQFKDNMAVLKHNKDITEVPARMETAAAKFSNTMVRFDKDSDVQEICIGGTNTKIVFSPASGTAPAAGIQ